MSARIAVASLWMTTYSGCRQAHGDGNNRKKKQCIWWCAACGGQYEWRAPNRILVVGANASEATVFRAHAALQKLCDNLINA